MIHLMSMSKYTYRCGFKHIDPQFQDMWQYTTSLTSTETYACGQPIEFCVQTSARTLWCLKASSVQLPVLTSRVSSSSLVVQIWQLETQLWSKTFKNNIVLAYCSNLKPFVEYTHGPAWTSTSLVEFAKVWRSLRGRPISLCKVVNIISLRLLWKHWTLEKKQKSPEKQDAIWKG